MSDQELVRYKLDEHGLLLRQAPKRFAFKRSHKKEKAAREKGLHYLHESSHQTNNKGPMYQRVIPAVGQVRAVLMSYFHGSRGRGHPGVRRTVDSMQRLVYWQGMYSEIRDFIKACPCMRDGALPVGRVLRAPPGANMSEDITGPDQLVCLDHCSMPKDEQGYCGVQVMVDAHSHDLSIEAVQDLTAETPAEALFKGWIQHKGLPKRLHTDGARALHGAVVKSICKLLGVDKSVITSGNSRGNSLAENGVHRVRLALNNLASKFPRKWRKFLPLVQYVLKMTHDDEVGLPPHYAHTGKMPKPLTDADNERRWGPQIIVSNRRRRNREVPQEQCGGD